MKKPALWRYLWNWTLGALAVAWVTLMAASYYAGLHEAEEITDAHLASAVNVLLQVSAFSTQPGDPSTLQIPLDQEFQSFIPLGRHLNLARSLAVVVWDNETIVADSRPLDQRWALSADDGYSTFSAPSGSPSKSQRWRMFAARRHDNAHRAAAMINMEQRSNIGRHVALTIARPALVVLPLVALLLWWATRRGMRPLNALSARVAGLNLQNGARLNESHSFAEFASVISAINGLIDRLELQVNREREFASDVAHELRTPLAAIALQAQNAMVHSDSSDRTSALRVVQREALRAGQILGELLELARAQSGSDNAVCGVGLDDMAARVMADFAQASHESGHQLELVRSSGVTVSGNPLLLELALRNLISNALAHTGPGTIVRVEVARSEHACALSVSDSGGGSTEDGRRLQGEHLGIGLKLVHRIAGLHHAQFHRQAGTPPMATTFSIIWGAHALGT